MKKISNTVKNKLVREYIENKISQNKLAIKYGINPETVAIILRSNGIKTKYFVNLDEDKIVSLYVDSKMSVPQIVKELKLKSIHPVYSILRKKGLVRSMSECHFGQPAWNKDKKWDKNILVKLSNARKGKFKGKDNPNWKGGKTRTSGDPKRKTLEYTIWRRKVKERDNYKCLECGSSELLHSHHIVPVRNIVDLKLLTDVNNGITLCIKCHRKTYLREKEFEIFYKGLIAKAVNSGEAQTGEAVGNPEPSPEGI